MSEASPEEQRLLSEVFLIWDGRNFPGYHGDHEIYLGYAFEQALNRDSVSHFRVPERISRKVENYIKALREVERTEVE